MMMDVSSSAAETIDRLRSRLGTAITVRCGGDGCCKCLCSSAIDSSMMAKLPKNGDFPAHCNTHWQALRQVIQSGGGGGRSLQVC